MTDYCEECGEELWGHEERFGLCHSCLQDDNAFDSVLDDSYESDEVDT